MLLLHFPISGLIRCGGSIKFSPTAFYTIVLRQKYDKNA